MMTRVIIIITRMTASHLKAEQEISLRLVSFMVVWPCSYSFFFCLTHHVSSHVKMAALIAY